nr:DUF2637 domain-containing protein [Streptomyces tsukubensis]
MQLTRTHRILVGVVVAGAVVIAAIGFAGSYAAVRKLAEEKGFGDFSLVFPIGIDAGICVLLSLDLLLTWIRIPFPLLRQAAWLLTAATIAFNGATAWPDPLGVGMHAVIPLLFVVCVEAARHAIGRIADITADKHMEGVRLTRWVLSPLPTFLLWRRMKLWELRSYEQVIKLEQERLVYRARLRSRFGRAWRRKAPVESLMPLRLARYGVPLAQTAASGLAAAGIEPALLPPAQAGSSASAREDDEETPSAAARYPELPAPQGQWQGQEQQQEQEHGQAQGQGYEHGPEQHQRQREQPQRAQPQSSPWFAAQHPQTEEYAGGYDPSYDPPSDPSYDAAHAQSLWDGEDTYPARADGTGPAEEPRVPAGPNRTRPLRIPSPRSEQEQIQGQGQGQEQEQGYEQADEPGYDRALDEEVSDPRQTGTPPGDLSREEAYFVAFRQYVSEMGEYPNARQFGLYLQDLYGMTGRSGGPLTESTLRPHLKECRVRYQQELDPENIA